MTKTGWVIMGLIGAAVVFGSGAVSKPGKIPVRPGEAALRPAPVKANEKVSAETFKIISSRNTGMRYYAAKQVGPNKIEFTPGIS